MAVTISDVEYVAQLARLAFSPEEKERLTSELNAILRYMEQLNELDTSEVEPLAHVLELQNVFREDSVRAPLTRAEALQNAPDSTPEFFRVPKVIADR